MSGKIIMVEYKSFLERYLTLPDGQGDIPKRQVLKFKWNGDVRSEYNMCNSLAKSINASWLQDMHHEYTVVATQDQVDPADDTNQRVDLAVYTADSAPNVAEGEPARWSAVELSIECKTQDVADDPFDEDAENFEPASNERKANLGQIMSYAALIFAKQQRTHHFTVVCFGHKARIIRWDRAGVVVTKKFDYYENGEMLGRFFWRFVRLSDAQRGHDMTVKLVKTTSDDYDLMRRRAETPITLPGGHEIGQHARLMFKKSIDESSKWYRITVHGSEGPEDFLVGAPHFISTALAGRGTRGCVAIRCSKPDGPLCHFKDAWRVAHESMEKEGDILVYLNDSTTGHVENVPTVICHGDVEDQETDSQKLWRQLHPDSEACPLKTHCHYRIVVNEVALPMSDFSNGEELVMLLMDCMIAHEQAFHKGVMHRDVSTGNVLIKIEEHVADGVLVQDRRGLLTDWELSKRTDTKEGPRQPDRTGTWQFLSAYTLSNPGVDIVVPDELEAFFHVLLFYAIRFLPHNCTDVGTFIHEYFDGYRRAQATFYCGTTKLAAMRQGEIHTEKSLPLKFYLLQPEAASSTSDIAQASGTPTAVRAPRRVHPITALINSLLGLFEARYRLLGPALNTVEDEDQAPATSTCAPTPNSSLIASRSMRFRRYAEWSNPEQTSPDRESEVRLTLEQRQLYETRVATLQSHRTMLEVYARRVFPAPGAVNSGWPAIDKTQDQLPKGFRPGPDPKSVPSASELQHNAFGSASGSGLKRSSMHDPADVEAPPVKRITRASARSGV